MYAAPWNSLVDGDEQLDGPSSQTCMEGCHAYFWVHSQSQQLTAWADTSPLLFELKNSMGALLITHATILFKYKKSVSRKVTSSVTRKKSPNVYKSCPKIISQQR